MGDEWEWKLIIRTGRKGGPGSGNFGHAGRPGQVGGSAAGKVGGGYGTGTVPEKGFGSGQETALFLEKWFTDDVPNRDWRGANEEVRGEVKVRILQELVDRTGIDPEKVNAFIKQWSYSSNDEDMRSLAIQADAAAEFGIKLSEFTKGNLDNLLVTRDADLEWRVRMGQSRERAMEIMSDQFPLMESADQRKLLRAMYDHTQEQLANAGLEGSVTLYRGVKWGEGNVEKLDPNGTINITGNALESWSFNPGIAERFAKPSEEADEWTAGVVLAMDIPVKSIIGTAKTGFGCLNEAEVVVLGIDGEALIRSTHFAELPEWGEEWDD